MPQHMTEEKKCETFLEVITGLNDSIDVIKIDNGEIQFKLKKHTVERFLERLSDRKNIEDNVLHAVRVQNNSEERNETSVILSNKNEESDWRNLNGEEILRKIFDAEYLASLKIFPISNSTQQQGTYVVAKDDKNSKILTIITSAENKARRDAQYINYKILRLGLSIQSLEASTKTILGCLEESPIIKTEAKKTTEFAGKILRMTKEIKDEQYLTTLIFNYGIILKKAEEIEKNNNGKYPPIVSYADIDEKVLCFNKNYLLKYVYNIIPAGILFKENEDKLRPILFRPEEEKDNVSQKNISFHLILDKSGSMAPMWENYVKEIGNIITIFIGKNEEWNIVFTLFNTEVKTYSFSYLEKDRLKIFLSTLSNHKPDKKTDLFGTLNNAFSQHITESRMYTNNVVLVATDGYDNVESIQKETMLENAEKIVRENNQIKVFTMGFGDYDKKLFEELSEKTASTHMDLENVDAIKEIKQYIGSFADKQIIVDFLYENRSIFKESVYAGGITIASKEIDKNQYKGMQYKEEDIIYETATKTSHDKYQQKGEEKQPVPVEKIETTKSFVEKEKDRSRIKRGLSI